MPLDEGGNAMTLRLGPAKAGICAVALWLLAAHLPAQKTGIQLYNPRLERGEQCIRSLVKQFPEANLAGMARIGAEIQRCVDSYVMTLPATPTEGLNSEFVDSQLAQLLSGEATTPRAFVLDSGQHRALLVYDNLDAGPGAATVSYAALAAFNVEGQKLTLSDSTASAMDGYGRIDIKELPSPVRGEIWLLISGYAYGANGPNCRMRVYAYDGKRFVTQWLPANMWGNFTIRVTPNGFFVIGDYYVLPNGAHYRATHLYEHFQTSTDGLYLMPW